MASIKEAWQAGRKPGRQASGLEDGRQQTGRKAARQADRHEA